MVKEVLSVLMLCTLISIFTSGSSALLLRAPTLWFIDLTVATCHIQYTFLSLCQFVSRENGQNRKILKVCHFRMIQNGHRRLLGAQSINTERTSIDHYSSQSEKMDSEMMAVRTAEKLLKVGFHLRKVRFLSKLKVHPPIHSISGNNRFL